MIFRTNIDIRLAVERYVVDRFPAESEWERNRIKDEMMVCTAFVYEAVTARSYDEQSLHWYVLRKIFGKKRYRDVLHWCLQSTIVKRSDAIYGVRSRTYGIATDGRIQMNAQEEIYTVDPAGRLAKNINKHYEEK